MIKTATMLAIGCIAMIASCMMIAGCIKDISGTKAVAQQNVDYQVKFLFRHNQCNFYRFADGGYHYFMICDDGRGQVTD